ncbi:MAG: DUF2127 domain-containing protein [Chloroflexi bacterium]|nr:DUF2127 domain-containing protein [Chloroflexota bacterium]
MFLVNAGLWFGLGTYLVVEMVSFGNGLPAILVGFFMYLNSGCMLFSGIMLHKRKRWAYPFALVFLFANILLTFTDQFGVMDFFTLVVDLVILIALLSIGRKYMGRP